MLLCSSEWNLFAFILYQFILLFFYIISFNKWNAAYI